MMLPREKMVFLYLDGISMESVRVKWFFKLSWGKKAVVKEHMSRTELTKNWSFTSSTQGIKSSKMK